MIIIIGIIVIAILFLIFRKLNAINENNKESPLTRESAEEYRKIHHPDQP